MPAVASLLTGDACRTELENSNEKTWPEYIIYPYTLAKKVVWQATTW